MSVCSAANDGNEVGARATQLQWAKDVVRKEAAETKIRVAYLAYITRINYLIMISNVISCQCEKRKWIARKQLEEIREQRHLQ